VEPSRDVSRLIEIMAALRNPDGGCPWDLEQSFETIAPYTIEEAYEVADAIERRDLASLKDELGCCSRSPTTHGWQRKKAPLPSATWSRR
jgi:ATP diphosphatase